MLELIKSVRKRGFLPNFLHVLFNVLYVAALVALLTVFPENPWAALGLVVIAKWRVLAVRPRYWLANFLSNLTDLLMGLGMVILMWQAGDLWLLRLFLAALYTLWLVWLKPLHRHIWVVLQAGISQFVALWALFSVAHLVALPVVVIVCFVIGFASVRHGLSMGHHEEGDSTFLALAWGFIVAELGFVGYHWTLGYPVNAPFKVSQMAIIVTVLAFVVERAYDSFKHREKVRWQDIRWPVLFAAVMIGTLLFFYSGLGSATQL
jgi:hypothetical protein